MPPPPGTHNIESHFPREMRMRRFTGLCIALLAGLATPLAAQDGLRSKITELFTFGDCGDPLCLEGLVEQQNVHGDHFIPANVDGNRVVIAFIENAIGRSVANTPLGATSSGVTFTFEGGVPVATSLSSGPIFAERSQTLGRGRVFLGANVTGLRFQRLRGVPLDDLTLNLAHEDVNDDGLGDPEFENDLIQVRVGLDIDLLVTSFLLTYGVTDWVDIGIAVPIVRTSLKGASVAQVVPFGSPTLHFFAGTGSDPVLQAATSVSGTATGIGDVATRVKINVAQGEHLGVGLMGDARLPTGNEADFLGAGNLSWRVLGILSGRWDTFSPHLNTGYLVRSGEFDNDAIVAVLGFDNLVANWATVAAEFISEWQVGESKLSLPEPITFVSPFQRTVQASAVPERRDNLLAGSVGLKVKTRRSLTLVGNAIVPLGNGGLQPGVVWTGGLEFNF